MTAQPVGVDLDVVLLRVAAESATSTTPGTWCHWRSIIQSSAVFCSACELRPARSTV